MRVSLGPLTACCLRCFIACVQYPVTCSSYYASICEVPHKSIACPVSSPVLMTVWNANHSTYKCAAIIHQLQRCQPVTQ